MGDNKKVVENNHTKSGLPPESEMLGKVIISLILFLIISGLVIGFFLSH